MSERQSEKDGIRLGDIIRLQAPGNVRYDGNTYLVDYISPNEVTLINIDGSQTDTIVIEKGRLRDIDLRGIEILSRAQQKGYARQNKLLPNQWIDLFFKGDVPAVFTGQIVNLDEDMIEVRTYPENERIYIDFGYKGLPRDLPLDKITLRDKPIDSAANIEPVPLEIEDDEGAEEEADVPQHLVKEQIRDLILEADEIMIGEQLDEVTHMVEVPEEQQRFGVEKQSSDMLDEMLSEIPNEKRTDAVLNSIHRMIQRFRELREEYSDFDEHGNAHMPELKGADHKPIISNLRNLNRRLQWLIPIARNKKKIYDADIDDETSAEKGDINNLTLAEARVGEDEIITQYKSGGIPDDENRLTYLLRGLKPFQTPFECLDNVDEARPPKHVATELDAVIDSLEDFYSSVVSGDSLRKRRFVMQRYNLGLNRFTHKEVQGGGITTVRTQLTSSDELCAGGYLMLSEPVIRFSRLESPSTNILTRCDLSQTYHQYWQELRQSLSVNTTFVSDPSDVTIDWSTAFTKTNAFVLSGKFDDQKYDAFLDAIIPRTKTLFDAFKKYVVGSLSLHSIVEALEPFMVFYSDLSFKQYEDIVNFTREKIREYKKTYIEHVRDLAGIRPKQPSLDLASMLSDKQFHLMAGDNNDNQQIREYVEQLYQLAKNSKSAGKSPELMRAMLDIDDMRFYSDAICGIVRLTALPSWEIPEFTKLREKLENDRLEAAANGSECKSYTLVKRYTNREVLDSDNGMDIFVDSEFDSTPYPMMNDYEEQQKRMTEEEFIVFLTKTLEDNIGLSKFAAKRDAEAMFYGRRKIIDGEYAVLSEKDDDGEESSTYFKRVDNKWIQDNSISASLTDVTQKGLCESDPGCFQINKECLDQDEAHVDIKAKQLENMVDAFADQADWDANVNEASITASLGYSARVIQKLIELQFAKKIKYDKQRYELGLDVEESEIQQSPRYSLLQLILGQSDFSKRQHDILRFANRFTREALENEDQYWRYCLESGAMLLPTFLMTLAQSFVVNNNYYEMLSQICAEQGTISDDGEAWVDKHSGYTIRPIDFDTDEGYTEEGFKAKSREQMEDDLGNRVLQNDETSKQIEKSPIVRTIENIIDAISTFAGINIGPQKEAIVRNTLISHKKAVPSEEAYQKAIKPLLAKGAKNVPTYENAYDESLLLITLSYIVFYIQVSVPSVTSSKTHPGCKRSFSGYPLAGEEDLTGIKYIACIAHKIRSNIRPWSSIAKKTEATLTKKIKGTIDIYIVPDVLLQEKIREKLEYNKLQVEEDIPVELDIRNWSGFMPPLVEINMPIPSAPDAAKMKELQNQLRRGDSTIWRDIGMIQGKAIRFSMNIIQNIGVEVRSEVPLLANAAQEAFIENACCNEDMQSPFNYFNSKNSQIGTDNATASKMMNIVYDIAALQRAPILYNPRDTRFRFPALSKSFSEETIYKAFMVYCKYNTNLPVSEKLRAVCMSRPDNFDPDSSIESKIRSLKQDGHNYGLESLDQLMTVINNENLVHIDRTEWKDGNVAAFIDLIDDMVRRKSNSAIDELLNLLETLASKFSFSLRDQSKEMISLRNHLITKSRDLEKKIESFLKSNSGLSARKLKPVIESLKGIAKKELHSNPYHMINKEQQKTLSTIHNTIYYCSLFGRVFPSIIENKVDYEDIPIPKHWKLSQAHVGDVREFVDKYYSFVKPFYDETGVDEICKFVKRSSSELLHLVKSMPGFAGTEDSNSTLSTEIKMEFSNFAVLYILNLYIEASDNITLSSFSGEKEIDVTEAAYEEMDVVRGERKSLKKSVSNLLIAYLNKTSKIEKIIQYTYDEVMQRVLRSKEREKDNITEFLKQMTDEEREVENLFKNNRLEKWSKGLQKGLTQYVKETYDEEREQMLEQALRERKLGKLGIVAEMNRDIYAMDMDEAERTADEIEKEEYSMAGIPDDDDYDNYADDAYSLSYD